LFPSVLPANDDIHFRLRCREFIEMMGRCSRTRVVATVDEEDDLVKVENKMTTDDGMGQETDNGDKDDDEDEEYEDAMDVDDFTVSHTDSTSHSDEDDRITSIKRKKASIKRKKIQYSTASLDSQIETAMKFGQKLQQDYQDDAREDIQNALEVGYPRCSHSSTTKISPLFTCDCVLICRRLSHCWHIQIQRTALLVICYTHRRENR
jgi:hypothetical protein